jgi:hypothetical protein
MTNISVKSQIQTGKKHDNRALWIWQKQKFLFFHPVVPTYDDHGGDYGGEYDDCYYYLISSINIIIPFNIKTTYIK